MEEESTLVEEISSSNEQNEQNSESGRPKRKRKPSLRTIHKIQEGKFYVDDNS